jgi:hypothetical protein
MKKGLIQKKELEAKIASGDYTKKDTTELVKLLKKKKFENFPESDVWW